MLNLNSCHRYSKTIFTDSIKAIILIDKREFDDSFEEQKKHLQPSIFSLEACFPNRTHEIPRCAPHITELGFFKSVK